MCHVPEGPEGYRRLIRVHTSLDLDAAEIHQIGLDEIARIDVELAELAGRAIGAASLAEALAQLRSDPALYFSTRDEIFDAAAACLDRANAAIPDWFGRLPIAACDVIRMGPHEEDHSTIAYYRQPAIDGSRPGPVLPQHRGARDAAAVRARGARPTTSRSRAITSRSRSARSCRTCRSSGATSGRRRSSRAGACTPSA